MKKVIIILAEGFEETEFTGVCDVLRRLGVTAETAGLGGTRITGSHGITVIADRAFSAGDASGADALFLPGGMPGTLRLRESDEVLEAVRTMHAAGKIISAICAAPSVLAKAGILEGRKFTVYPGLDRLLCGCVPCSAAAVRDGNIVTGKGPGAVFAFALELAGALGMRGQAEQLYREMFVE